MIATLTALDPYESVIITEEDFVKHYGKAASDLLNRVRADERKKVLATREEEIKQAVKMATLLERQAVIKEIEELLVDEGGGETHNTTHDQQVRNQLRCKLLVKLQEMNEKV